MDYEKKYKEALTYVKNLIEHNVISKENAGKYFPELKESEDERIRREMIEIIKNEAHEFPSSVIANKSNSWIAWLEKYGQETSWKPSKEEMDVLYGLSYITNEFDERKEEVITQLYQDLKREFFNGASFENMFPTNTSVELEKQGEQKPAWSEEDEENLRGIIWEIEANKCSAPQYDIATYDRFLSWLKSLKDKVQL